MRLLAPLVVILAMIGVLVLGIGLVIESVTNSETRQLYARAEATDAEGRAKARVIEAEGRAIEAERRAQAAIIEAEGRAREAARLAEAAVIDAQSRAKIDNATARAIITAANLPYFSIIMGFIFGVVVLSIFGAMLVFYLTRRPASYPQIERQIIMILPDGQTSGQVWSRTRQLPREAIKWLP